MTSFAYRMSLKLDIPVVEFIAQSILVPNLFYQHDIGPIVLQLNLTKYSSYFSKNNQN